MQKTMEHHSLKTQSVNKSPLLSLPAELRNSIYGYVVTDPGTIDVTTEQQPALIRACAETRSECLQMYYASNTFAFTPVTRGQDSLAQLERWLSRIGPENCGFLRELLVNLSKDTGLLINEPVAASNDWTALYAPKHNTGYTSHLYLNAELDKDMRPVERLFEAFTRLLGSKKAAEVMIDTTRKTAKMILNAYLFLLERECFDGAALEEWTSTACSIDSLASRTRDLVCHLNSSLCLTEGKLIPVPLGFPTRKISHALAKYVEAFALR